MKIYKKAFVLFLKIFIVFNIINWIAIQLIGGFWDGGLGLGLPFTWYRYNCGMAIDSIYCPIGFFLKYFVIDAIFFYILSFIIKTVKKDE